MKQRRAEWHGLLAQVRVDDLVFLDEFGAATNMTRTRARAPVGQRAICHTPHGHWKLISTIAAMTIRGMICCGTFDGATDTDTFVAYMENLACHLRPGQVVVMAEGKPSAWTICRRIGRHAWMNWWRPEGLTCCDCRRTRPI